MKKKKPVTLFVLPILRLVLLIIWLLKTSTTTNIAINKTTKNTGTINYDTSTTTTTATTTSKTTTSSTTTTVTTNNTHVKPVPNRGGIAFMYP